MSVNLEQNDLVNMPVGLELLPDAIRIQNLEHGHRLLVYVLRRPDNEFKAPNIEPLLRNARRVMPEYVKEFYTNLSGLCHALIHYVRMEESCTMSGKYRKDLDAARDKVSRILEQFESAEDQKEIRYLQGMLR